MNRNKNIVKITTAIVTAAIITTTVGFHQDIVATRPNNAIQKESSIALASLTEETSKDTTKGDISKENSAKESNKPDKVNSPEATISTELEKEEKEVISTKDTNIENKKAEDTNKEEKKDITEKEKDSNPLKAQKEETIYVNADAKGNRKEVIVSDWLKNKQGENEITDKSDLEDIINVKGDETFSKEEDNVIKWASQGKDIYYQGTTQKQLPVEVKITYYLDGVEIEPEELEGKSGKVTIRFDYTNHEKKNVTIGDKKEEIYVPFAMMSGMILNVDDFSNVEVKNGKVLSDGNSNVVVGVAFPGLKESIGLEEVDFGKDFEIPDYVEITADTTNCSIGTTMTIAVSDVLSMLDLDDINSFEDFSKSLTELSDGAIALEDGSKELWDGLKTLQKKTTELTTGVTTLANGASELKTGANTLNSNMKTFIDGLSSSKTGAGSLVAGYEGETGAIAGAKALAKGISSVDSGVSNLKEGITSMNHGFQASIDDYTKQLKQLKTAQAKLQAAGSDLSVEQYEQMGQIEGAIAALQGIQKQMTDAKLSENIATLKGATSQLNKGASSLSTGLNQLYEGTKSLTSGIGSMYTGGTQLKDGTAKIAEAASQVATGANTLKNGTDKLTEGIQTLESGSEELYKGAKKFNKEGIQKIVNVFDGDFNQLLERMDAVIKAGEDYTSFTDITKDTEGSVKFIIKTE